MRPAILVRGSGRILALRPVLRGRVARRFHKEPVLSIGDFMEIQILRIRESDKRRNDHEVNNRQPNELVSCHSRIPLQSSGNFRSGQRPELVDERRITELRRKR
jgi:hypothetical protein